MSRRVLTFGLILSLAGGISASALAQTTVYNDGVWRVDGIDDAGPIDRIALSVDGVFAGNFTELQVYRSFQGGTSLVYSILANGSLRPVVPANGVLGGGFQLTGYYDCYAGQRMGLRITALNIVSNAKNFKRLMFRGNLSDGISVQSPNLLLKLDLPDAATVRLNVKYTLYATSLICVDLWRQNTGEGFQVARMSANYVSGSVSDNDSARVKAFLEWVCDCCHCWWIKGYLCTQFSNRTGYIFPYQAWMAGNQLRMLHSQLGPQNTATLAIETKSPKRSKCSAQGYLDATIDPATNNVSVWVNWDFAKTHYEAGRKIANFKYNLLATLPGPEPCDRFAP